MAFGNFAQAMAVYFKHQKAKQKAITKKYTQAELEAMTVDQIKALAEFDKKYSSFLHGKKEAE